MDEPRTDLETVLTMLVDDLSAAVPSFLGLIMTQQLNECPIVLSIVQEDPALTAGASISTGFMCWTVRAPPPPS